MRYVLDNLTPFCRYLFLLRIDYFKNVLDLQNNINKKNFSAKKIQKKVPKQKNNNKIINMKRGAHKISGR